MWMVEVKDTSYEAKSLFVVHGLVQKNSNGSRNKSFSHFHLLLKGVSAKKGDLRIFLCCLEVHCDRMFDSDQKVVKDRASLYQF